MRQPPRAARFAVPHPRPADAPADWKSPLPGGMAYAVLRRGVVDQAGKPVASGVQSIRLQIREAKRKAKLERNHRRSQKERLVLATRRHRDAVRTLRRQAAERRAAAAAA